VDYARLAALASCKAFAEQKKRRRNSRKERAGTEEDEE
jgi:hypothetical protein